MAQFWAGYGWGIVSTFGFLIFVCVLLVIIYGVRNSKTHGNGLDMKVHGTSPNVEGAFRKPKLPGSST